MRKKLLVTGLIVSLFAATLGVNASNTAAAATKAVTKTTVETSVKASSSAAKVTTKALKIGSVTIYNFGKIKLHAYTTNDALGDQAFIIESKDSLVVLESPAFVANLKEWKSYFKGLKKKVAGVILAYHPTGYEYYGNAKIYTTQNALTNWGTGGAIKALLDNFTTLFGESFDATAPTKAKIVKEGKKVTIGGIEFKIIASGDDAFSVEIPAINCIYRHMMGSKVHNILASKEHIDATIAEFKNYQKKNYNLILTSHYVPEDQKAVTTKIAYLENVKKLAVECKSADEFIKKMNEAYPDYAGADYLTMTAGFLFPQGK